MAGFFAVARMVVESGAHKIAALVSVTDDAYLEDCLPQRARAQVCVAICAYLVSNYLG
jgi:hypothetical protein